MSQEPSAWALERARNLAAVASRFREDIEGLAYILDAARPKKAPRTRR